MSMLKKATNKMAYAKVGIYGGQGAGKSRTAAEIAIGLYKAAKCTKPVAMFDTEPGASFLIPFFDKAGIEFLVYDESRAFSDLMKWMDEATKECSVLIVDSITHIWRDLQESYLLRVNDQKRAKCDQMGWTFRPVNSLEFQHWGPIKREWATFTDAFLSSKAHVIVCGRAGSVYEYQEKEDGGKKELITVGTKMATEKEMGHEPSLLIEMERRYDDGKIVNTAVVVKDRADKINGREIAYPSYEKLRGHFDTLNFGGEHFGSMAQRDSRERFTETGEDTWGAELRRKEVALDEIKEEVLRHLGHGMDAGTKAAKAQLFEDIAGTRSWAKIESFKLDRIQEIRNTLWVKSRGHAYGQEPPPPAEPLQGDESIPQEPNKADAA
jgi:hypothetical protein